MAFRVATLLNGGTIGCLIVALVKQLDAEPGTLQGTAFGHAGEETARHLDRGQPIVVPWLILALCLTLLSVALSRRDPAGRGPAINGAFAVGSILIAALNHDAAGGDGYITRPLGGTDFTGFFSVDQPTILPWLIAAGASALAALAVHAGALRAERAWVTREP